MFKHFSISKKLPLTICVFGLLLILPVFTNACGGFFCTTTPIDQSAERIIFAVNKDEGTITAVVGISYTGEAKDFSWVIPVPSIPQVDVAEIQSLDALQSFTNPSFANLPPNYCDNLNVSDVDYGGGAEYLEYGQTGPYDYVIIRNTSGGEMITWLRENGYRVTDNMIPIIKQYIDEDMYFLAMKLKQDAQVGDIKPVVMTYQSEHPMIPLRLTAVAAMQDMPIYVWIFSDTQYIPENYANPSVDFSTFRGPQMTANMGKLSRSWPAPVELYNPNDQYNAALINIQNEYKGRAFVTEYAQPTEGLSVSDDLLNNLLQNHLYLTRLRAQISPEQMTLDPTFIPASDAPNVSGYISLNSYVDPLTFWGCSTRSIITDEQMQHMPSGRIRFDDLQFEVAYPENWVMSHFTHIGVQFTAFSPQPIDGDTLDAFITGEDTPPVMLFWVGEGSYFNTILYPLLYLYDHATGYTDQVEKLDSLIPELSTRTKGNVRYWPRWDRGFEIGINYGVFSSAGDWQENAPLYEAMAAYAGAFQHFTTSDLENTLFLGQRTGFDDPIQTHIPFPSDWHEYSTGGMGILPDEATDFDSSPAVKLTEVGTFIQLPEDLIYSGRHLELDPSLWGDAVKWMTETYHLSHDMNWQPLLLSLASSNSPIPAFPFETDQRKGYVRFTPRYIIEASAPLDQFAAYNKLLKSIIDGVVVLV